MKSYHAEKRRLASAGERQGCWSFLPALMVLMVSCSRSNDEFCSRALRSHVADVQNIEEASVKATCRCQDVSPAMVECRCEAEVGVVESRHFCQCVHRRGLLSETLETCRCRQAMPSDYIR